jgi:AAA15 family ATPase/GTPase
MLKSLEIKNFRALEDFKVSKLGRVNLIVGKNNSGKSSILEALRIYAGSAHRSLLEEIAAGHDEKYRPSDTDRDEPNGPLPFENFFTGRHFPDDDETKIIIGETIDSEQALTIEHQFLVAAEETVRTSAGEEITRIRRQPLRKSDLAELIDGVIEPTLQIRKNDHITSIRINQRYQPQYAIREPQSPGTTPSSTIPTRFISLDDLAEIWDKIGLTDDKNTVKEALKIIAPEFEDLMFIDDKGYNPRIRSTPSSNRTVIVRLGGFKLPVPINSMGDGMLRILQLILKVFPAKGGFLLIDEFENGLHYSVQKKVWELLFDLATKLDIQIFAATHSWDCIESFAQVAKQRDSNEAVLFRVGRSIRTSEKGKIIATVFNAEQLFNLTQSDVEVR